MSITTGDPALSLVEVTAVRAAAADELNAACDGWRRERRCSDGAGRREPHPHPDCLRAQYRHDRTLLEHGLLGPPT